MVDTLKHYVLIFALTFIALALIFSFLRSLIGPRIADRIVAGSRDLLRQIVCDHADPHFP